jgi:GTP:adenosylcobinamide-phosphate guanylyltransferase
LAVVGVVVLAGGYGQRSIAVTKLVVVVMMMMVAVVVAEEVDVVVDVVVVVVSKACWCCSCRWNARVESICAKVCAHVHFSS